MKTVLGLFAMLILSVLPTHADQIIDYTETVQNAPGGIGDFSWTVQTVGFIEPPGPFTYVGNQCTNCDANLFTPIESSAPSNSNGCRITGVWLWPNFGPAPVTEFSPKCDGLYDAFSGGVLPDVGTLGTWDWTWENPDGSENSITLSITDPPSVPAPEPRTWSLLACGIALVWIGRKIRF